MDQILKNLKLAELEQLSQQINKELDVRYRQKTAETIKDHIEQHGYYAKAGYDTYELNDPKIHYVDFKIKIQLATFDHLNFTNPIPDLYDSDSRYQSKIYKYLHLPKVPAEWTFGSDIWECHGQHMPSTQLVDSNIRIWHKPILPDGWFSHFGMMVKKHFVLWGTRFIRGMGIMWTWMNGMINDSLSPFGQLNHQKTRVLSALIQSVTPKYIGTFLTGTKI